MSQRNELDRAIDVVAGEMTSAHAPELRIRVLEQLDARRGIGWFSLIGVSAAGIALALGIAVHSRSAVPQSATMAARGDVRTAASLPPVHGSSPTSTLPEHAGQRTAVATRTPILGIEPAQPDFPALAAPPALTMSDIQPKPLEIRPLVTELLVVERIEIADGP
jgi:hypothetical protein